MRQRFILYYRRILEELQKSFHEEHTDREIAGSFAVGIFITAMPTLGTGFIMFWLLMRFIDGVSRMALLTSVVVMNPIIKPLVYLSSINLGSIIITRQITFSTEAETVILFLLVGNLIIALVAAMVAYVLALGSVRRYRASRMDVVEDVIEDLEDEVEKELEHIPAPDQ